MTVSEQIIQVLNALCEKFGIAIDWTGKNVVPYVATLCGKLVSWEIWTSVAWIAIMVVLSIIATVLAKKYFPILKEKEANQGRFEDGWTITYCFAIAGIASVYLATFIVIGVQVMDIVKCVTFPEMYAFEYVTNLIESAKQGG